QQRIDDNWYQGTADAVYQNIYAIERERPQHIVVLAGDHIYKMNYGPMIEFHRQTGADMTIGALRVPLDEGTEFGVMAIDDQQRVIDFAEKPALPASVPGDLSTCLASMGIYIFTARFLYERLCDDASMPDSRHDFGHDIIPRAIR